MSRWCFLQVRLNAAYSTHMLNDATTIFQKLGCIISPNPMHLILQSPVQPLGVLPHNHKSQWQSTETNQDQNCVPLAVSAVPFWMKTCDPLLTVHGEYS